MNPNDIYAQQQAAFNQLNQALQHVQYWSTGLMVLGLAVFMVQCWVVYLFYARLRDIANELMKFRIAYEFAEERNSKVRLPSQTSSTPPLPVPQTSKLADA